MTQWWRSLYWRSRDICMQLRLTKAAILWPEDRYIFEPTMRPAQLQDV